MKGHREESIYKLLDKNINTAAILGGICIGLLTIIADFIGAIGTGYFLIYIKNIFTWL